MSALPQPAARVPAPALPIGVFDSGAGGLSVVAAIRAALPGRAIVYYADTAYAPYGSRSDAEILARTEACCALLLEVPLAALVVACNTATANGIDAVRRWACVPVVGVEPGLKPATAASKSGIIGVLATQATLASRRYRDLAARVRADAPAVRFVEHAARGWVELVESGDLESVRARTCVRTAVGPLLDAGADTLVLGCTHYPFLRRTLQNVAGNAVQLIETGPAVARELQRRLKLAHGDAASATGKAAAGALHIEASADGDRFRALAERLLGVAREGIAEFSRKP